MKLKNEEFNEKALDVKVEPSRFKRYTGDVPKTGTILIHRVTKMWWTQAEDGTSMIKVLAVAEDNTGEKKKFNGLPTWEYLVFKPEGAWRYVPFLQCFGITLRDIKSKMFVADEPDNIGDIIESLGGWEVGSDDALCRIVINRKKWEGDWQSRVDRDGWLPLDEEDEEDELDDEDIDEDEEEDEPPARPARRGAKAAATPGPRRPRRAPKSEPEPDEDDDEEDEDFEEEDDLEDELDEEDDVEEEDEEAEEEDQEEEDARPARTRRAKPTARSSRTPARAASSPRTASSGRSRPASARSTDGSRSRSSRTPTAKQRGSKDDPPF
jgi:hypothetical protein